MSVEIVPPDEVEGDESTPGIVRKTVFETDDNVMVYSRVAGDTTTGWHHHCDRHAYGYILRGQGAIEYGSGGSERLELDAPLCFHIPPRTVHREITETDTEVVVSFVGSGPLVENVEDPTSV
jgi:mannose-6-phosphate isomerase-like protein (cupin superfamily)